MEKDTKDTIIIKAIVETVLPKGEFKVKVFQKDKILHCRPSGKIRKNYIKMISGDKVMVRVSKYDLDKGVITYRGWR